jgi:hypothetical protein
MDIAVAGDRSRKLFDLMFTSLKRNPPKATVATSDLAIRRDLLLNSDMVTAVSLQWFYKGSVK